MIDTRREPLRRKSANGLYTVRAYNRYDGWYDIRSSLSWEDARSVWLEKTGDGTRNTDRTREPGENYYDIFPENTRMVYDAEFLSR